ncbi:MAG: SemiSWEET transporter [Candidatus Gracilibacteria bacterium]|jgi:MtN3 and saliva related transmembrane protein
MKLVDIIGYIAGGLGVASLIPQVIKSWQTKLTRDLSFWRYFMYVTGLTLWVVYGALIQNGPLLVMNGIAVVLAGSILCLKIKYK